jgi:general secretion pathway protein G
MLRNNEVMVGESTATRTIRTARSAFTLIELLLVMVIIAILAAVVVPRMSGNTQKAQRTRAIADISGMKTALGLFELQNGRFPNTDEGLAALVTNPGNLDHWEKDLDTDKVPMDPWNHAYIYRNPGTNGNEFDLLSAGPDGQEGTQDDITPNTK